MKKINMIIGKKQIILASLVVILGIAIYLNWQFAKTGDDFIATNFLNEQEEDDKNYGDTQLVDKNNTDTTTADYFAAARLSRQKSRDEAAEALQSIFGEVELSAEDATYATMKALELTQLIESEGKIENLIKAQGFNECVAYLDGESATVIVETEGLTAIQAAQIKDAIVNEVAVDSGNITISEINPAANT